MATKRSRLSVKKTTLTFTAPWKTLLAQAQTRAQSADFTGAQGICKQIASEFDGNPIALLDVGALLLSVGFISNARTCFERAAVLSPTDFRAKLNLANCARESGDHRRANELYLELQAQWPDNPTVRRNTLISQQYNPATTDEERLTLAKAWGEWAIARAGGPSERPFIRRLGEGAPGGAAALRVGYVSADFCQHTVGLLVKDVLRAQVHQALGAGTNRSIEVYAYSSGLVNDWVTHEISSVCNFRDVSGLDDVALASLIREDKIDVLVDLSGHTAGSRLTVFAHRPAPVQVTWLGYFATTGLSYVDAVFLDECHAPPDADEQFVEDVVRLEAGRFCYQPVPWATEVSKLPSLQSGFITFGSFNNTSKLNAEVFDLWAGVMRAVPKSRLLLKWRTLVDDALRESIRKAFEDRGVSGQRIELRPASFHVDLLKEYADIDIALDPFPFTGGLTSCEALWMGVPVITLPQGRAVGRQTFALLSAIGKAKWAAKNVQDYIEIAKDLADDPKALANERATLRHSMRSSTLMDVGAFAEKLGRAIYRLHDKIKMQELGGCGTKID
jgi:predicted O-linked N-acetylglucosamine transferase (SPINDLY family)